MLYPEPFGNKKNVNRHRELSVDKDYILGKVEDEDKPMWLR